MRVLTDVSVGDWIVRRAGTWATAGGVAGTGFDAYARMLHPMPAEHHDGRTQEWRWADVARRQSKTMHPLVQSPALLGGPDAVVAFDDGWSVDRGQVAQGRLSLELLRALLGELATVTSTDQLIAAVWSGWGLPDDCGFLFSYSEAQRWSAQDKAAHEAQVRAAARARVSEEYRRAVVEGPLMKWPGREMVLLSTTFEELNDEAWPASAGIDENPLAMLWPTDHTWVVASEIDWDFTIVAGPTDLIDRVIADPRWEAVPVSADDDLSWAADVRNQ